jgi:hypothetical protein
VKLRVLDASPQVNKTHQAIVQHVDSFSGHALDGRASNLIDAILGDGPVSNAHDALHTSRTIT